MVILLTMVILVGVSRKTAEKKLMKQKSKKRKITPSSIVGMAIGFWLIGAGLYHALIYGAQAGYYVAVLGLCLNTLIYWSYKK